MSMDSCTRTCEHRHMKVRTKLTVDHRNTSEPFYEADNKGTPCFQKQECECECANTTLDCDVRCSGSELYAVQRINEYGCKVCDGCKHLKGKYLLFQVLLSPERQSCG